jgi:hypothetical protein
VRRGERKRETGLTSMVVCCWHAMKIPLGMFSDTENTTILFSLM